MAKNKQKQKGLLESVHDGYIRGSMEGRKILLRHESLLRQNHYQMK